MKKLFFWVMSLGLALSISGSALASGGPFGKAINNMTPVQTKTQLPSDLSVTIGSVVRGILSLVGTIFLLLTIYAGILWMTAQGNEEKVSKAKQIVQAAVIGLVITMAAYAITAFVTGRLNSVGSNSSTNVISCSGQNGTCYTAESCQAGLSEVVGTDCRDGQVCCR